MKDILARNQYDLLPDIEIRSSRDDVSKVVF